MGTPNKEKMLLFQFVYLCLTALRVVCRCILGCCLQHGRTALKTRLRWSCAGAELERSSRGDGKDELMGPGVISSGESELRLRALCLKQHLAKQRELPEKSWFCIAQITDGM